MADIIVTGFFSSSAPGFVGPSGGGTLSFLRADGVWTTPPGVGAPLTDGDKGDITVTSGGAVWTVDPGLSLAKLESLAAGRIVGASSAGPPVALTGTQTTALLDTFTSSLKGLAPASGGSNKNFLRADGVWGGISGATFGPGSIPLTDLTPLADQRILGNVSGPSGSVAELTATQVRTMLGLPPVTWSMVAKTADSAFTSTTPADVSIGASGSPYMGWTLAAAHTYHFRFVVIIRSDTTSIGIGLSVTVPSAATFGAYGLMIGQTGFGPSVSIARPITVSDDPVITTGVDAANTDYVFLIEGVIQPNSPGDLRLRARIETGVATTTVRQGSFGILMDQNP